MGFYHFKATSRNGGDRVVLLLQQLVRSYAIIIALFSVIELRSILICAVLFMRQNKVLRNVSRYIVSKIFKFEFPGRHFRKL